MAVTSALGALVVRGGRLRAEPTGGIGPVKLSDGEPLRGTSGLVRLRCTRSSLGLVVLEMERAVPHAVPLGQVRQALFAVPSGVCSPCPAQKERASYSCPDPCFAWAVGGTQTLTLGWKSNPEIPQGLTSKSESSN